MNYDPEENTDALLDHAIEVLRDSAKLGGAMQYAVNKLPPNFTIEISIDPECGFGVGLVFDDDFIEFQHGEAVSESIRNAVHGAYTKLQEMLESN